MRKIKTNLRLKRTFTAVFFFCSLFAAYGVQAKGGILTGAVLASSDGTPLPGVTVHVVPEADTSLGHYTFTNSKGKYKFVNLTPGKYSVTYSLLGYVSLKKEADVSDEGPTTLNIQLSEQPLNSEDVVITASRHEEKVTHAPASISVVPAATIREHVSATPTDILSTVPGIDVSREGIAMATYSSRSMHSVFGSDMLTMNDYHSMEVPAIGGFYGILMPQVPDDIDHVEVIRGPGSALYGPDAATGVVHFISRSPFASQGTNISLAGGERSYMDGAFRHAQALSDKFAFKISGHYLRANDWPVADDPKEDTARKNAQAALVNTTVGPQHDSLARIGNRDYTLELYSFEGRADAVLSDDMTLNLTGGLTNIATDVALTEDFGAAQIKNWMYDYVQGRLNYKDIFFQADINHNNTRDSYFLPTGAKISDHSTTYSVQLQHHYTPWTNEQLTYGGDFRAIHPNTDSTLYGPQDGHANVSIYGAYLQSQTSLLDSNLDLVLAGRIDKLSDPNNLIQKPIFSPRAAAVYHLDALNLVRAMYNETYLLPSENRMFADIVFSTDIYGFGSEGLPLQYATTARFVSPYVAGASFPANGDGSYNMYSRFKPGAAIPSNTAAGALWSTLAQLAGGKLASNATLQTLLGPSGVAALESVLQNMNAPTPQQVSTFLAYINLNSASNTTMPILPTAAPLDISGVQPQHQRTLELDYQGAVSKTFQFEVDGYQTHYTSVVATTVALTPNVFINTDQLKQYLLANPAFKDTLQAHGGVLGAALADTIAGSIAASAGQLPLGVIQPNGQPANEMHPYDLLIGSRGYLDNAIEFYGIDALAEIKASDTWDFTIAGSWLNKNYWFASELRLGADSLLQNPFSLNMPKYRASVSARYSGLAHGLVLEMRDRWSDGFKMLDNYYEGDVSARHVLDLTVNYRPDAAQWNNLLFTLSITNLLDYKHQEFIGAPYIGRLTVLRAAYTLPTL